MIHEGTDILGGEVLTCDVCIIGSGAGGAVLAAGLAARGLEVIMVEEGGAFTKEDFDLDESHAMPMLYQERGTRATSDQGVTVLQGRSVGGTTTINWTTCFRTPGRILEHWRAQHGAFDGGGLPGMRGGHVPGLGRPGRMSCVPRALAECGWLNFAGCVRL